MSAHHHDPTDAQFEKLLAASPVTEGAHRHLCTGRSREFCADRGYCECACGYKTRDGMEAASEAAAPREATPTVDARAFDDFEELKDMGLRPRYAAEVAARLFSLRAENARLAGELKEANLHAENASKVLAMTPREWSSVNEELLRAELARYQEAVERIERLRRGDAEANLMCGAKDEEARRLVGQLFCVLDEALASLPSDTDTRTGDSNAR